MKNTLKMMTELWQNQQLTAEIDLENTAIELGGEKFFLSGRVIIKKLTLSNENSAEIEKPAHSDR